MIQIYIISPYLIMILSYIIENKKQRNKIFKPKYYFSNTNVGTWHTNYCILTQTLKPRIRGYLLCKHEQTNKTISINIKTKNNLFLFQFIALLIK